MSAPTVDHPGRSLLWALIESGGLSLLSLIVLLMVARLAGPADLGAFAIALGIIQLMTMVVEMLLHDAIIQRPNLTPDHLHTAFWTSIGLGLGFSILCWFAAPLIGDLFSSDQVRDLLAVSGLSLAFTGAGCVPIALLRREVRFRPLALRSLVGRLCGAIVAVIMVAAQYGVWSLVAQHVIQVVVSTLLVWPASSWRPKPRFSLAKLWELLAFGAISVSTRLVWMGTARLFVLLIGNVLGVAAVGYLNIAQRLVDTLFDLLAGAAHNFALPIFSRRQHDRASLLRAYGSAAELVALTTTPIFAGLALCAGPAIALLLGEVWLPATPLVWLLAGGAMIQFIVLFGPTTLTALGRPGIIFMFSLLTVTFVFLAFFILRPDTTIEATAIWAVRGLLAGPLLHITICRMLSTSPWNLVRAVWVPLLAVAVMATALVLLDHYALDAVSPLMKLAIMIPVGAVVYGVVVALAGRRSLLRLVDFGLSAMRSRPSLGS